MSGEAWPSGAWLGAQLPRTHPAQTSISLGIANLTTMHVLKYGIRDLQSLFGLICSTETLQPPLPPPPGLHTFEFTYDGAIGQPIQTTSLCNPLATMD
jgi:hypothetical protein